MNSSDDALIKRYLAGDITAFEELYQRYTRRLVGFVVSLGAQYDTADDISQKAWLKVIKHLENYSARGSFRAWLFTIARRLWLDQVRSAWTTRRVSKEETVSYRGADDEASEEGISRTVGPAAELAAQERQEFVHQALQELPKEMRETILLRIDGGMTYREIAEEMNCPLGTVSWRMREAQNRLSRLLKQEGKDGRQKAQ